MEIKNCEQYVLAELEAAQRENDELRDRIAELEREAAESDARKGESPDGEVDPRQVQIYKLNEPFETAYLTVKDSYDFGRSENSLGLTAEEIREKAATEEGLREVAGIRVGWSRDEAMSVDTRIWPCQLHTGTQTFVMDLWDNGRNLAEARVCKDEEKPRTGNYFPAYRAEELERFGLDLLKKRLLEYADKLDAEAAKDEEEK